MTIGKLSGQCDFGQKGQSYCDQRGQSCVAKRVKVAWLFQRRCPALQKAEIFLKVMEARIKDIEVLHWDNRLWGEIPADFGNK